MREEREASADGVDLVLLHELHGLGVHFLRVILVALLDLLHLGLEFLHPLHRLGAGVGQRPEEELDDDGDDNDAVAVTNADGVDGVEGEEQALGHRAGEAVEAHDTVHVLGEAREGFVLFGPGVEVVFLHEALAGRDGGFEIGKGGLIAFGS